jgi:hypothetical protein
MKTIHVEETAAIQDLFEQAQGGPVLVQGRGGRTFVLAEVDKDDVETYSLAGNADLDRILDRSRDRAKREGWLSTDQVRKDLGIG